MDDLRGDLCTCGGGRLELSDPGPQFPRLRLFTEGIGDRGLPLRFALRWNSWRSRRYRAG